MLHRRVSAEGRAYVAASVAAVKQQNPPRDRRPGEAGPETARERELKKRHRGRSCERRSVLRSSHGCRKPRRQERSGSDDGGAQRGAGQAIPRQADAVAGVLRPDRPVRARHCDARDGCGRESVDAEVQQLTRRLLLGEGVQGPVALRQRRSCATSTRASRPSIARLRSEPDYSDALVYKNILLRMKAEPGNDAGRQTSDTRGGRCAPQPRDGASEGTPGRTTMAFVPRDRVSRLHPRHPHRRRRAASTDRRRSVSAATSSRR